MHLTFGLCTPPTDTFPFTYHPFNGPNICRVENSQCLRFGNSCSPEKFTVNLKRITRGRGGWNEGRGGRGKRDRRYFHPYLLLSGAVRDEAYAIYDTLNLCFPANKINKSKTTMTTMTNNFDYDHATVREEVKTWMKYVRSASASASASAFLESQHFLVKL